MLRYVNKAKERTDEGFSLVELLVVIIIIGILAAIAVPLFLNQQAKANDTAAKADVSTIGKEISTYFVDNDEAAGANIVIQTRAEAGGGEPQYWLTVTGATTGPFSGDGQRIGPISTGVSMQDGGAIASSTAGGTVSRTNWCIGTTHEGGQTQNWRYTATGGLQDGEC